MTQDMWQALREQSAAAHDEGAFVAYLGCEWSAMTPPGGDRNVVYFDDEPRLCRSGRFFTEDVDDPEPDLTTAPEFLEAMKDEKVLINIHAGGRPTNLEFHEPRIEMLAEIHSTHGTSEWFFLDALRRGYRVGVTAGTDGVCGRPGADHPGSRQIRNVRNGINFTERGFGIRGAKGTSDRGHSAASQMRPGDIDWDHLFGELGVRWFHTGGIFAALSPSSAELLTEAVKAAQKYGTIVSYDLNYRHSLWQGIGGKEKAQEVNPGIAPYVDVMIGNEEDFSACLGLEVEGVDENISNINMRRECLFRVIFNNYFQ